MVLGMELPEIVSGSCRKFLRVSRFGLWLDTFPFILGFDDFGVRVQDLKQLLMMENHMEKTWDMKWRLD